MKSPARKGNGDTKLDARRLVSGLAITLALVTLLCLSGCTTADGQAGGGAGGQAADEYLSMRLSADQPINLLVTDGVGLVLPRDWQATRRLGGAVRLESPEEELKARLSTGPSANAVQERIKGIAASYTASEKLPVGGTMANVTWAGPSEAERAPLLVRWAAEVSRQRAFEFLGRTSSLVRHRQTLQEVLDRLAFEPYGESARIREALFAFHSFGRRWRFHADLPTGATFLHLAELGEVHEAWSQQVTMALTIERVEDRSQTAAQAREEIRVPDDSETGVVSLDHLGPTMAGRFLVHERSTSQKATAYTAVPFGPSGSRWKLSLLVRDEREDGEEQHEIWQDQRISNFFEVCFTAAP